MNGSIHQGTCNALSLLQWNSEATRYIRGLFPWAGLAAFYESSCSFPGIAVSLDCSFPNGFPFVFIVEGYVVIGGLGT